MPTLLTHPAIPLAMALGLGRERVSRRLLVAGVLFSIVPDLDVIGFKLGIPYAADYGHRGLTHSLLFAFILALTGTFLFRTLHATLHRTFWFLFISIASHSLLDAFTNGGLGVALLWPWTDHRYFAPIRMIQVSPINPASFMSRRSLDVLWSELIWVWLPLMGLASAFAMTHYLSSKIGHAARERTT